MPKGQQRGNKEARKPRKAPIPAKPAAPAEGTPAPQRPAAAPRGRK